MSCIILTEVLLEPGSDRKRLGSVNELIALRPRFDQLRPTLVIISFNAFVDSSALFPDLHLRHGISFRGRRYD